MVDNFSLPPFRPAVLEPGFDLSVGHFERLGQGGSLGWRQVLLSVESLLQLHDLKAWERRPRLLTFGRRSVLVRMPDSTCYWKDWIGYMYILKDVYNATCTCHWIKVQHFSTHCILKLQYFILQNLTNVIYFFF